MAEAVFDFREEGSPRVIYMPTDESRINENGKTTSLVLAHEITHHLIDDLYKHPDTKHPSFGDSMLSLENDCDRLGLVIYLLATAIEEEERNKMEEDEYERQLKIKSTSHEMDSAN